MQAHRIETTVAEDGTLVLHHLPFQAGEQVEVIVLKSVSNPKTNSLYPLRGEAGSYQDPTEPVAVKEWEAMK